MRLIIEEYLKLQDMLKEAGIPFETCIRPEIVGFQIIYPSEQERVCSVVIGAYTYGGPDGLLEIMGLLTEEESGDTVLGWLTAENVFNRIQQHWLQNGGTAE